ncbi:MAG TPA: hypothetical protein PL051_04675 [Candidatus Saccharibacteria bacterium]|nr:hypothetical protein [Candidatus Saccharibacteria bacterium]
MTNRQRGAVSIFIVVFTALLVTVVTASFVQIMLRGQQEATNSDLSQSAYDAALAGVEDAKRALIKLRKCEQTTPGSCSALRNAIESGECEFLGDPSVGISNFGAGGEVQVGSPELNQAYTCVTAELETDSVEGTIEGWGSDVISLDTGGTPFTYIVLSWFNNEDVPPSSTVTYPADTSLPTAGSWSALQPPLMRAQLIQYANTGATPIALNSFDGGSGSANARSLFLMPSEGSSPDNSFTTQDTRQDTGINSPQPVSCDNTSPQPQASYGGYYCQAVIAIPSPEGGSPANRIAYLQLSPYYNNAHYRVQLYSAAPPGGDVVTFDGVQPRVDSTGRASDLFRRVSARVSIIDDSSGTSYPNAALSVENNICKNFFITDEPSAYNSLCEAE